MLLEAEEESRQGKYREMSSSELFAWNSALTLIFVG